MKLADMTAEQIAERFEYLDELRESAVTNMFGAAPYVERRFGHDRDTARELVKAWMNGPSVYDTTPTERAAAFLRGARAT